MARSRQKNNAGKPWKAFPRYPQDGKKKRINPSMARKKKARNEARKNEKVRNLKRKAVVAVNPKSPSRESPSQKNKLFYPYIRINKHKNNI